MINTENVKIVMKYRNLCICVEKIGGIPTISEFCGWYEFNLNCDHKIAEAG
jgi:hypothetical protein